MMEVIIRILFISLQYIIDYVGLVLLDILICFMELFYLFIVIFSIHLYFSLL